METVIREGTLRLLTTESSCDVILSCRGRRLMAHKVILSIVSPVFRNLLLEDSTVPTVIILPDISSHTMSLILDYIYTGTVVVYSNTIQQFLSLTKLFKIKLDIEPPRILQMCQKSEEDIETKDNTDIFYNNEKIEEEFHHRKNKKLPELIPIHKMRSLEKLRNRRKMSSCVLPSPWHPRIETILGDPRENILEHSEYLMPTHARHPKPYESDTNNNFQPPISRYYQHNSRLSRNSTESYPFEETTTVSKVFPNINQTEITNNGLIIPTTVSRPPEEVAIDRDKAPTENRRISNWIDSDLDKCHNNEQYQDSPRIPLSNSRLPVLEPHHSPGRSSVFEDDFKEDSNGSIHNIEYEHVGGTDKKLTCGKSESELTNSDKEKPFKCEQCGKCFSQLRNFKYHRSVHEGTKEFAAKCSECGKVFNDKGYLSSHMKIHRDKKEYACPHCPKRFNQRVAYNMHTRIHTGLKPHECPTCGKSFSRKMLLKQHQRVHTGERPYSCPECGKTFADRSNMSLHARLHTGVKPYACTLCPKSFTKKHHLKTHMNFHTGLKPYTCQKCGLAFSQSSNMRTHYKKCLLKSHNSENERHYEEEDSKHSS